MSQSWKSLKQNMSIFRWNISFLTIRTYISIFQVSFIFLHSLCASLNSAHSPPKLDSLQAISYQALGAIHRDPPARKRPRLPSKNTWHQQIAFGNQWNSKIGIFSCENKGVWLLVSGRVQGGPLPFINGGSIAPINGRKKMGNWFFFTQLLGVLGPYL